MVLIVNYLTIALNYLQQSFFVIKMTLNAFTKNCQMVVTVVMCSLFTFP